MEEQLRNLKELDLRKNLNHVSKDPDKNLTDPTCFDHYLTLDFHKLNIKNTVVSQSFIQIFLLPKATS